jgi:LysR family nitrogen assimilation transcriptional regulator
VETKHLKSFLKIADMGSISRAAESLGIAQPSLSQQLLRLEDELHFSLFRRTARGVTLTEAGRIFQEHARNILRNTELAIEDIRELTAEPSGSVILAVPYSISKLAGVPLVEAFMRHAPQINFRLDEAFTGQIRGWLETGKVDIGIMNDLGSLRHLSSRRLASEELYLIGPAGRYGTLNAMPDVQATDLTGLPMILPGLPHGLRQIIEQETARLGATLTVRTDIDAMQHICDLVAAGHGFSILPVPVAADALAAGKVSIARIEHGAISRTLCLVRNSNQVVTHASVRCEDLTIKVLSRLIEKGIWRAEPDVALR